MKKSISEGLLLQMINWQAGLASTGAEASNVFTGINCNKDQFFCDTSALGLYRMERVNFMRKVLIIEECTAFAHSMKIKSERSGVSIDIYSGQDKEYWWGRIENLDGEISQRIEGPYETPRNLFHEILQAPAIPFQESENFLVLWNSIRVNIYWRSLN